MATPARRLASRMAGVPLIVILLVAPPLAHLALLLHRGEAIAGFLIALQAVAVTWIASAPLVRRDLRLIACAASCLLVVMLWRFDGGSSVVASAVPHAMIYLGLLAIFGRSLAPGQQAVATYLARLSRGHMTPSLLRYTRRVTWAWSWFFAAQIVVSFMLLAFAPLNVWSMFVNVCNLPLLAAMLLGEFAWRQWRHAAQPPERLIDMFRIYRRISPEPVSGAES